MVRFGVEHSGTMVEALRALQAGRAPEAREAGIPATFATACSGFPAGYPALSSVPVPIDRPTWSQTFASARLPEFAADQRESANEPYA